MPRLPVLGLILCAAAFAEVKTALEVSLEIPLRQLRAAPVSLGAGARPAILLVYGQDTEIDPYHEMFFYPKGSLRISVLSAEGKLLWTRDPGRGVVPGIWFCPVLPFDLDGDGADEIWFVNNIDPDHPLSLNGARLERLDSRNGKTLGQWRWNTPPVQSMSHTYRNFILGGHSRGTPVLVTAQGTYAEMALQGWNADMSSRWTHEIPRGPGPRGSHQTPIADFDGDGVDELVWGERRIDIDRGRQLSCADCDSYNGHSDIVQPFLDRSSGKWFLFTCRENDPKTKPRVAAFRAGGERIWGDLDYGHIDTGWVAHPAPQGTPTALAIRIDSKQLGPQGLKRRGVEEFLYHALTGERLKPGFDLYGTIPVDIDGDGYHEFVRGDLAGSGELLDASGRKLAGGIGRVSAASKLLDLPGEQILAYYENGTVRIFAESSAKDSDRARARYANRFYRANQRAGAVGYNLVNLGGL